MVYHLQGDQGMPMAPMANGYAAPFWSTRARAERGALLPRFAGGYVVESVPLDEWRAAWLPNLAADGFRVGLNWSRDSGGYVVTPDDAAAELSEAESARRRLGGRPGRLVLCSGTQPRTRGDLHRTESGRGRGAA